MKKLLLALITVTGAASLHGMEPQKQLSPISLAQTYHQFLHSDPALPQDVTQQIFSFHLGGVNLAELEQSCKDSEDFVRDIKKLLNSCGYELASELCKHYFSHAKISICDIKYKSSDNTALHYAAFKSKTGIAKLLLNTAGDNVKDFITIQNKRGDTALHYTVCRNSTGVAKLLLNAAGDNAWELLTIRDKESYTALHTSTLCGNTEIVKLLLNTAGDNAWTLLSMEGISGQTVLHEAVSRNHTEIVKILLNAAGNKVKDFITIRDKYGKTAFDIAKPKVKEVMQPYLHKNNQ